MGVTMSHAIWSNQHSAHFLVPYEFSIMKLSSKVGVGVFLKIFWCIIGMKRHMSNTWIKFWRFWGAQTTYKCANKCIF